MKKVGSTTDTADSNGEYTNGNVANGISPTVINAEMLNTFQRELVAVVEGAGITLDPANDAYGSGGSGAMSSNSPSAAYNGGTGGNGLVIILEYA